MPDHPAPLDLRAADRERSLRLAQREQLPVLSGDDTTKGARKVLHNPRTPLPPEPSA